MAEIDMVDQYLRTIQEMGLVVSAGTARAHFEAFFDGVDFDNKRVLDIGGGTGVYSFYAASRGAREVVCMEPEAAGSSAGDARTFERIRSKLPEIPVTRDTSTIQEYPVGEPFDVVFMHASINHIDEESCIHLLEDRRAWENYERHFARIASHLRRGGKLVISDCGPRNFFQLLGLKNPLCPSIEWRKHQPPEAWVRLLSSVGFRNPRIRWEGLYGLGRPGRVLLSNRPAAYFLKSTFYLDMEKA
jgi:SAM-dependent methyltransferase